MLKYYCEHCNYNATSKMDQNRHNRTKGHKDKITESIDVPKLFIDDENNDADLNSLVNNVKSCGEKENILEYNDVDSSEKNNAIELLKKQNEQLKKQNEQLKEQIESLKGLFKSFSDSPIADVIIHITNDYYDAPNINQLTSFEDIYQTITSNQSDETLNSMHPSFQDEPSNELYLVIPPLQNKSKKKNSVIRKKEINNKKQENGYYDDMSDSEREFLNDLRELKEEEMIRMKKPGYISLFIDS